MNLTPFLAAVNDENVIPKVFDQSGNPIKHSKGLEHKYYVERMITTERFGAYQSISQIRCRAPRLWKGIDLRDSPPLSAELRAHLGTHVPTPTARHLLTAAPARAVTKTTLHGGIAIDMTPNMVCPHRSLMWP